MATSQSELKVYFQLSTPVPSIQVFQRIHKTIGSFPSNALFGELLFLHFYSIEVSPASPRAMTDGP